MTNILVFHLNSAYDDDECWYFCAAKNYKGVDVWTYKSASAALNFNHGLHFEALNLDRYFIEQNCC
jgi:hypothetical protein